MNALLLQITPFGQFRGTSLFAALGNMFIFALAATVLLFLALKVFDKALTRLDLEGEIGKGNVAVAIFTGSLIIGLSIILAVSMV